MKYCLAYYGNEIKYHNHEQKLLLYILPILLLTFLFLNTLFSAEEIR